MDYVEANLVFLDESNRAPLELEIRQVIGSDLDCPSQLFPAAQPGRELIHGRRDIFSVEIGNLETKVAELFQILAVPDLSEDGYISLLRKRLGIIESND